MYAVVHTVTLTDRSAAEAALGEVVPTVTGLPGFVAGYWVARTANEGVALVMFESEEAAQGFANFLKTAPDEPDTTLNRDSIDVGQVLASA